jgi:hypothetical protein
VTTDALLRIFIAIMSIGIAPLLALVWHMRNNDFKHLREDVKELRAEVKENHIQLETLLQSHMRWHIDNPH